MSIGVRKGLWVATALIAAAAMLAGALGEGVTDTVASSRSVLCIQVIRARVWLCNSGDSCPLTLGRDHVGERAGNPARHSGPGVAESAHPLPNGADPPQVRARARSPCPEPPVFDDAVSTQAAKPKAKKKGMKRHLMIMWAMGAVRSLISALMQCVLCA